MFIVKKKEEKTHQKRRGSQFGSSDISLQRGDHVKSFHDNQSNVATFVKRAKQREKKKEEANLDLPMLLLRIFHCLIRGGIIYH